MEELAIRHYHAEKLPSDPRWEDLSRTRQDAIRARVRLVLEGEVRRSECGPGDLAVWLGRFRSPLKGPPPRFHAPVGTLHEVSRCVVYDSIDLDEKTDPRSRLFGSRNVGHLGRSNLQLGGELPGCAFLGTTLWVGLGMEPELERVTIDLLSNAIVTVFVGEKPVFDLPAYELWKDPHSVELLIPRRQNVAIEVGFYGAGDERNEYGTLLSPLLNFQKALKGRDRERPSLRLYVYLEGWRRRDVA
jgi:hypothetical protein